MIPPTKFTIELVNPALKNPSGNKEKTRINAIREFKRPFFLWLSIFEITIIINPIINAPIPHNTLSVNNSPKVLRIHIYPYRY